MPGQDFFDKLTRKMLRVFLWRNIDAYGTMILENKHPKELGNHGSKKPIFTAAACPDLLHFAGFGKSVTE